MAASRPRMPSEQPGDIWHLNEIRVVICGQPHWMWRAVDQDG
ncbi:hypothetical protein [Kozakia baliensis]